MIGSWKFSRWRNEDKRIPSARPPLVRDRPTVFVSHSSIDKYFVAVIVDSLTAAGATVHVDHDFLESGDRFEAKILDSIKTSDFLAVVWSANANASDWVTKEIEFARSHGKAIIPCRIDDSAASSAIADLHFADFRSDIQRGLQQLHSALAIVKPQQNPASPYIQILFSRALEYRLHPASARSFSIPGVHLNPTPGKIVRIRNKAYECVLVLEAPSRSFLEASYGSSNLGVTFVSHLMDHGWSIKTIYEDNYDWQTKYQPTMIVAKKGHNAFAFYYVAEDDDRDWKYSVFFLKIDEEAFLYNVLGWIERGEPLVEFSDDLIVLREDEAETTSVGRTPLSPRCSFQANFGGDGQNGVGKLDLLPKHFEEILRSEGYDVQEVDNDDRQSDFAVALRVIESDFDSPIEERQRKRATSKSAPFRSFDYIVERQFNAKLTRGLVKVSILKPASADGDEGIVTSIVNQDYYYMWCLIAFLEHGKGITIPENKYFKSVIYKPGEMGRVALGDGRVAEPLVAISADRGLGATSSGQHYSRVLRDDFISVLSGLEFTVSELSQEAGRLFVSKLYQASHAKEDSFILHCESEENLTGTMAYMKCKLCRIEYVT